MVLCCGALRPGDTECFEGMNPIVKVRIMLIVEAMGGGVRRHVIDLIRDLDEERFELFLIYGESRADQAFFSGIEPLRHKVKLAASANLVRSISPKKDYAAYRELLGHMHRFQPDIVHCHSSKAGVVGRLAAKWAGVPTVYYTPHAYSFQSLEFSKTKKRLFVMIERWLGQHATTAILHVSEGECAYARQYRLAEPRRLKVIYNGIPDIPLPDRATVRRSIGLPEDPVIVGVAARFNEQKDPMTFARIAGQIAQQSPDTLFVYIGDGPLLEQVRAFVEEHGLQERVLLPGYRDDAEFAVGAFDAYLLTSLYEGFPYSLLEAVRAGVPVVATRTVGSDEIVIPGENGELFRVGDVQDGAEKLLQVIGAGYAPEAVRKTFTSRFTIQSMVEAIQQLYLQPGP